LQEDDDDEMSEEDILPPKSKAKKSSGHKNTISTPKSATLSSRTSTASSVRMCIVCKGDGKKGGFNNGKAIDFKNKFMVNKMQMKCFWVYPDLTYGFISGVLFPLRYLLL
jgi:hypothetical protein